MDCHDGTEPLFHPWARVLPSVTYGRRCSVRATSSTGVVTAVDVAGLQALLRQFAEERDWQQFHSPKNLSMALAAEAGELLEIFQWLTDDQSRRMPDSPADLELAQQELADVLIYVLRLADVLGIDLQTAVEEKLARNKERYPIHLARGNATKYSRRDERRPS